MIKHVVKKLLSLDKTGLDVESNNRKTRVPVSPGVLYESKTSLALNLFFEIWKIPHNYFFLQTPKKNSTVKE
jgi:hypothetical protein